MAPRRSLVESARRFAPLKPSASTPYSIASSGTIGRTGTSRSWDLFQTGDGAYQRVCNLDYAEQLRRRQAILAGIGRR